MLRQQIYEIIEVSEDNDKLSSIYDIIIAGYQDELEEIKNQKEK